MLANADLSTEHHVVLDRDTAGKPGLGCDYALLPEPAVVPNVDQVVDLRSPPDARFVERAAVDGCVGADLHIVFDHQPAYLGKFLVPSTLRVAHISEAIAPQHCTRMHDDTIAQRCPRIYRNARINLAPVPNLHSPANDTTGADPRALADFRILRNHGMLLHHRT